MTNSICKATALFRAFVILSSIFGFLLLCLFRELVLELFSVQPAVRQRLRAWAISKGSQWVLWILGFRVRVIGTPPSGAGLWVANHLSFWDILCLSSQSSPSYITSVEVRDTPVIGWLARVSGCVFVERRDRSRIDSEIKTVATHLGEGQRVTLFAEGTSGDGTALLPFKRSFFRAALLAKVPVYPICINYLSIDGKPVSPSNRDRIFYYGDHGFWTQLFKSFSLNEATVEIRFLPAIVPSEKDHVNLCDESRSIIAQNFKPLLIQH